MSQKPIRCWMETFASDVCVRFVSSGMGLRSGLVEYLLMDPSVIKH